MSKRYVFRLHADANPFSDILVALQRFYEQTGKSFSELVIGKADCDTLQKNQSFMAIGGDRFLRDDGHLSAIPFLKLRVLEHGCGSGEFK